MKQSFITFFHKPKQVAITSLVIAVIVGIAGYIYIHRAPSYQFATVGPGVISNENSSTGSVRNLTLGFLAGGRIQSVSVKVGDTVKKGDVLATLDAGNAQGAVTQAKAVYESAQANYQKVINGATGAAIDVAKAAVNTAQVNLDQVTKQQATLVSNAKRNLLNSSIVAKPTTDISLVPPTISGAYTGDAEGTITLLIYSTGANGTFTMTGLVNGTGNLSTTSPQPIGDTGLSIQFPSINQYSGTTWQITLPNTTAPNYLANYNAYQSALQTQTQAVASAQAVLDQANASLAQTVTTARPEDVAAAQAQVDSAYGALQIAQAAYTNTIITAPTDGSVTLVSIAPGQIATPNTAAIQLLASSLSQNVPVMIPQSALISRDSKYYVNKKTPTGITEVEVKVGITDALDAEVTSGLSVGDQIVSH